MGNGAILDLGHRDWVVVVVVVTPFRHARLPVHGRTTAPVDDECEIIGHIQLPGAFGQLDDQFVALDGDYLERSVSVVWDVVCAGATAAVRRRSYQRPPRRNLLERIRLLLLGHAREGVRRLKRL